MTYIIYELVLLIKLKRKEKKKYIFLIELGECYLLHLVQKKTKRLNVMADVEFCLLKYRVLVFVFYDDSVWHTMYYQFLLARHVMRGMFLFNRIINFKQYYFPIFIY